MERIFISFCRGNDKNIVEKIIKNITKSDFVHCELIVGNTVYDYSETLNKSGKMKWYLPDRLETRTYSENRAEIFEIKFNDEEYTEKISSKKKEYGIKNIILTLGEKGCVYFDKNNDVNKYEAYKVKAIDTTAAGDSFIGAFAMKICECGDTGEAIKYATAVSAIVVTRQGAQSSIPTKDEIEEFIKKN